MAQKEERKIALDERKAAKQGEKAAAEEANDMEKAARRMEKIGEKAMPKRYATPQITPLGAPHLRNKE